MKYKIKDIIYELIKIDYMPTLLWLPVIGIICLGVAIYEPFWFVLFCGISSLFVVFGMAIYYHFKELD